MFRLDDIVDPSLYPALLNLAIREARKQEPRFTVVEVNGRALVLTITHESINITQLQWETVLEGYHMHNQQRCFCPRVKTKYRETKL